MGRENLKRKADAIIMSGDTKIIQWKAREWVGPEEGTTRYQRGEIKKQTRREGSNG